MLKLIISKNVIVAFSISIILLLISHKYTDAHSFWHSFTHEIGFAFLVSVIIWISFEVFTSAKADEEWSTRIENITKSVFFGVLRRNLPEQYMKEVNSLFMEISFIRTDLSITYNLFDDSFKLEDGEERAFVRIETLASYKMTNITTSLHKLPMSIGLPNPLINEMKTKCGVTYACVIRGGVRHELDCEAAAEKFRSLIKDDNSHTIPFTLEEIDVAPNETVEVIFNYTYAKEDEDNEIYQSLYPADGISIIVNDRGTTERVVHAKSIGPHTLGRLPGTGTKGMYVFKMGHYLLPRQGAVVWWKKVPKRPTVSLEPTQELMQGNEPFGEASQVPPLSGG